SAFVRGRALGRAPHSSPRACARGSLLADATNLGLARMAHSSKAFSHSKLIWIAEWHVRDETYQAALACLIEAIHARADVVIGKFAVQHEAAQGIALPGRAVL